MILKNYTRKPFEVEAVQVTEENLLEVSNWCGGEVVDNKMIKVPVQHPVNRRQSEAHVGDWVLTSPKGFKCYTNKAFVKNFVEVL